MLRVQLPDTPGSLGFVATAMGTVDADISAVEIVEKGPGYAIDDFILTL
ncbi:MAG: amino acid-binding protein, partial [Acidipropionibacterium jensenii]|nr:amino acid-binding protein [Acidipropionibacterium jensenii]